MIKTDIIWSQFHDRLLRFIESRVSDHDIAEDLLQDVFIKIHNNIDSLKNKTTVGSWVYQITRNTIVDHYRSKKSHTDIKENHLLNDDKPENEARSEIIDDMKDMILELPEKYKQALILTEYDGLRQTQLAQYLNLSPSGARSRVQRARQMLRDNLMRCCHFVFDRYNQVIDYHPHGCCCCQEA